MGRAPAFTADELLGQAVGLAATGGPTAVTMKGVATACGAPSGSVYHRFESRPHLLAEVWRWALAAFQRHWWTRARVAEGPEDVAAIPVRWARSNRDLARVLLLHSAESFVEAKCPAPTQEAIASLQRATAQRLVVLAERFLGRADERAVDRTVFALTGIPLAALRRPLLSGAAITRHAETLVREAAGCLMNPEEQ